MFSFLLKFSFHVAITGCKKNLSNLLNARNIYIKKTLQNRKWLPGKHLVSSKTQKGIMRLKKAAPSTSHPLLMCQANPLPSRSLKVTGVKVVSIIRTKTNNDKKLGLKKKNRDIFCENKKSFVALNLFG